MQMFKLTQAYFPSQRLIAEYCYNLWVAALINNSTLNSSALYLGLQIKIYPYEEKFLTLAFYK